MIVWPSLVRHDTYRRGAPALRCRLPKRSSAPSRHRCREGAIGERQGATVGGLEGDGFAGLEVLARATASISALRSVALIWGVGGDALLVLPVVNAASSGQFSSAAACRTLDGTTRGAPNCEITKLDFQHFSSALPQVITQKISSWAMKRSMRHRYVATAAIRFTVPSPARWSHVCVRPDRTTSSKCSTGRSGRTDGPRQARSDGSACKVPLEQRKHSIR